MSRWPALVVAMTLGCSFSTVGLDAAEGETDEGSEGSGPDGASTSDPDQPPGTGASASGTGNASTSSATSAAGTTASDVTTGELDTDPAPETTTGAGGSTESGVASESGDPTAGMLDCDDVLFVAGSDVLGSHDQPFYDILIGLGASVTVMQDDLSSATDAEGRCLVVVSATVTGNEVSGKFRDVPVPLVTWEYAIYDDMDMTGDTIDVDFGPVEPQEDIEIAAPGHPMAAGLSGTRTVLAPAPGRMSWGMPGPDADVVATLPGDNRATLFGYEAGDAMVGFTAPAKRVGFPALTSGDGTTINGDGEALFEAALLWAVE